MVVKQQPVYTDPVANKLYSDPAGVTEVGGSASSSHNVLSASHSDSFAADTPADGNVLTWVASNSRWEAVAPAATVTPYHARRVFQTNSDQSSLFNVNSTSYGSFSSLRFRLDGTVQPWTHFRIQARGSTSAASTAITFQLATVAAPTVPLSAGGNDTNIPSNSIADADSGWIAFASSPYNTDNILVVALKGASATVDLNAFYIEVHFKYTP